MLEQTDLLRVWGRGVELSVDQLTMVLTGQVKIDASLLVYVRRTHLVERARFDALLGCYLNYHVPGNSQSEHS
jgi:hypothetical protein